MPIVPTTSSSSECSQRRVALPRWFLLAGERVVDMCPQDHANEGGVADACFGGAPFDALQVLFRQPYGDLLQLRPLYDHVFGLFPRQISGVRAVIVVG